MPRARPTGAESSSTGPSRATVRLDKWLWQARFFRSRTAAAEAVSAGAVRLNGRRAEKPAQPVAAGDTLTFVLAGRVRLVRVLGLPSRRGPATEARALYAELGGPPAGASHAAPLE